MPFWKKSGRKGAEDQAPEPAPVPQSRATGIHPLLPEAVALHQSGNLPAAAAIYESILRDEPDHFDAAHLLGVIALQEGHLEDAQRKILKALDIRPDDQAALTNLTAAYMRNGQLAAAAESGERAAKSLPPSIDAILNYAMVLHQLGRFREAIAPLEFATKINSRSSVIWRLLGWSCLKIGDFPNAIAAFEQATSLSPDDSEGWANLSSALTAAGQTERAVECAARAASLNLDSSSTLAAQASAQLELGKIEESINTYARAIAAGNPSVITLCGIARALIMSGRTEEIAQYLKRAVEMEPRNAFVRMLITVTVLKPIYADDQEIVNSRATFSQALTELEAWTDTITNEAAYTGVGAFQPFFLAYHPLSNKDLLSRYGAVCAKWMATLRLEGPPTTDSTQGRFRLGIISAHVRNHSVWNAIIKGWVHQLDPGKFEIFLFKLDTRTDSEAIAAAKRVAHCEDVARSLESWVSTIRQSHLDAIIFDEIGMNALTLQLAATRLAPVQAATWGHPETSGLPTMDFYLSGDNIEPEDGKDHYSEALVRLPNLGVYVDPLEPKIVKPELRDLGLPENEPLILCPGPPFKYSPRHDQVWIDIAKGLKARNSGGRLVFFTATSGSMHVQMAARLRQSFTSAGLNFDKHVCVIVFLDRPRYFGLMMQATLMLDTLDFSGFNTALQAMECGLPYLAFEGRFMRGRLASGILRRLELPELISQDREDFARKAVEISVDIQKNEELRRLIVERRSRLFRDRAAIEGLEKFLLETSRGAMRTN